MMRVLISCILLLATSCLLLANEPLAAMSASQAGFEENKGQIYDEGGSFRSDVHYVANFPGVNIFFTEQGLVYHFFKIEPSEFDKILAGKIPNPYTDREMEAIRQDMAEGRYQGKGATAEFYRIDLSFPGAQLQNPVGESPKLEKRNYFTPRYPDGIHDVPVFTRIRYENVYPGIHLVFYIKDNQLKYDFELAAEADPALIKMLYKGHREVSLAEDGNAVVKILPGEIVEKAPHSFQNDEPIGSQFIVSDDTLMFQLKDYDKTKPLTIDPALTWSTYFHDGTTSTHFTSSTPTWDSDGNMYVAINTYNRTAFPLVNPGGSAYYQGSPGSTGLQIVIMKFNTSRQIVWATYYSSSQSARTAFTNQGLTIDDSDNLYIVGELSFVYSSPTPSFPLYNPGGGAYYETTIGTGRNFILKFSSSGQRLWATMFCTSTVGGSSSGMYLRGITVDNNNKLLVTGETYTSSSWQPIPLVNPGGSHYYKGSPVESQTPMLARFTSSGSLEWSTYISQGLSSSYNSGQVITVDASNNIFLSGTAGQVWGQSGGSAYTLVNPGGGAYQDGFNTGTNNGRKISIFKFSSAGALVWCTLYGGSSSANSVIWQDARGIQTASNGDVFIAGRVNTTNFPTYNPGGGAYVKTTLSTGGQYVTDGIILQFSNGGVRKWATYYGGNGTSDGTDFMGLGIDGNDNIIVSGISRSTSFPTQSKTGSYNQSTMSGSYAIVFAQFNSSGVRQWATYFGTQTFWSSGGFGMNSEGCSASFTQFATANNSYAISTLNPGSGAYYQSSTEGTGSSTDIIIEFGDGSGGGSASGTITWTGAVDTDWFEPCNWDKVAVPTTASDVVIPGAPSNQPYINGDNAYCRTIEIQSGSGANLTINSDGGWDLNVTGP